MSPRPGPRREQVAFRLTIPQIAALDANAAERGQGRSDYLRDAVAYAEEHMPATWRAEE